MLIPKGSRWWVAKDFSKQWFCQCNHSRATLGLLAFILKPCGGSEANVSGASDFGADSDCRGVGDVVEGIEQGHLLEDSFELEAFLLQQLHVRLAVLDQLLVYIV